MASSTSSGAVTQPKHGFKPIFSSYFYWTFERGSVHYDIMVSLILLFIFVTPHLWNYGAKPSVVSGPAHPLQVLPQGRGVIVTVQASDVKIPPNASSSQVKSALREAIEPVTGDAVYVQRWETVTDAQGHVAWKVWAHR